MPIYVYGCNACGGVEEHIQRFSDPPLTECSSCGGRLEKQVTAAAFQLKGSGWYKDGYASAKAEKAGGGSDSGGSGEGSSRAASSSEGSKGASSGGSGEGSKGTSTAAAAE